MFRGRSPASLPEQVARASVSAEKLNEAVNGCNQFTGTNRYDAAGNMIENGLYMYDAESRLSAAGGVSYTYDGDGRRVKKSTGPLYWYSAAGDVLAESSVSGTLTAEYVFFHGRRIARRDAASGAIRYYFSDHLGSASVIANEAGTIVEESQYFPFGAERAVLNGDTNPYKFTGKERDSETGLDYFGARYYGSNMGRWLSPDWSATPEPVPYADLADPQSLNQYAYVRNNPTGRADLDGHDWNDFVTGMRRTWDALSKAYTTTGRAYASSMTEVGKVFSGNPNFSFSNISARDLNNLAANAVLFAATEGMGEEFSGSTAAEAFGFKSLEGKGSLFYGELKNGAGMAVEFTKAEENLNVGVSFVNKISAETVRGIEKGALNAAEATGSQSVTIEARMVRDSRMGEFLKKQGFTEVLDKKGNGTGTFTKTLKIVEKEPL